MLSVRKKESTFSSTYDSLLNIFSWRTETVAAESSKHGIETAFKGARRNSDLERAINFAHIIDQAKEGRSAEGSLRSIRETMKLP